MRNIYLCSILLFIGLTQSVAQSTTNTNTIQINHYNDIGKVVFNQILEDESAEAFNLKDYLTNHQTVARISVQGSINNSNQVNYLRFDGSANGLASDDYDLCEQHTTSLRPFFGLSGHSTEAFDAVIVDKVISNSPASTLGLAKGDTVYTFNHVAVQTFCDLKMQLVQCTTGQEVSVDFSKVGSTLATQDVIIGGQVVVNTKVTICDPKTVEVVTPSHQDQALELHMQVYPNPTTNIAHIKYTSTSDESVSVYILDQEGKVVTSEQFDVFTGSMHTSFNFDQFPSGTYIVLINQGNHVTQEKVVTIK